MINGAEVAVLESLAKTKGKGLSFSASLKNAAAKGETGVEGEEVHALPAAVDATVIVNSKSQLQQHHSHSVVRKL